MALPPLEKPLPKANPIRILCSTRFPEAKSLLRACARLDGDDFRCEILCRSNDWHSFENRIAKKRLRNRVKLVGEFEPSFEQTDVFVFASRGDFTRREGVPTVILSAMKAGVPVVVSQQPAVGELVVHGQTGLVVRPDDPVAFAEALSGLVRNPELRKRLGENARQRFLLHLDPKVPSQALRTLVRTEQPRPARQRAAYLFTGSPVPGQIRDEIASIREQDPHFAVCARETWDLEPTVALPKNPELNVDPEGMAILRKSLWNLGLQSEERECLWAIWLRTRLLDLGISHIHAATARDLLRAFLLSRIAPISLSVGFEPGYVPKGLGLRLAGYCLGGRVSDPRQLSELGPGFVLEPTPEEWALQLRMWSIRSPLGIRLIQELRARAFANAFEPLPARTAKVYEFPRFKKSRRASLIEAPSMK